MGIISGLGFALSYTPAIAMVGKYFSERKALAYGIALSGSGIGTFILAPVVQLLIEYYSWRGALLVLGGFVSNLCVCGALMRPLEQRGGGRIWENDMANMENDCMTTVLDSKYTDQVSADCTHMEPKQLEINHLRETQGLLIANGALKNFGLENGKLGQGEIALLSSPSLPDPCLTDPKIAECILISNKLAGTKLMDVKFSDPKLVNGNTVKDLKLVDSMNLKNKAADTDAKIEDSELIEAKPTDASHPDKTASPPPEPLMTSETSSTGCFLKFKRDYCFLMLPDFLFLSVSLLFLAYGCSAPVVYLVPYALSEGLGHKQAALLMSMFGVSGIVGNITFGWITDRECLKRYRMVSYMVAIALEGLCCIFIPLLHFFSVLVSFSVLYGYFDGAYVALIPVVTSDVVGSTYLTSALGVVYFLHAIPYLVSPPIGGWLVDRTGTYEATFFLCGASFLFCSLILAAAMLVRRCRRSESNSAAHLSLDHITAAAAAQQGII